MNLNLNVYLCDFWNFLSRDFHQSIFSQIWMMNISQRKVVVVFSSIAKMDSNIVRKYILFSVLLQNIIAVKTRSQEIARYKIFGTRPEFPRSAITKADVYARINEIQFNMEKPNSKQNKILMKKTIWTELFDHSIDILDIECKETVDVNLGL